MDSPIIGTPFALTPMAASNQSARFQLLPNTTFPAPSTMFPIFFDPNFTPNSIPVPGPIPVPNPGTYNLVISPSFLPLPSLPSLSTTFSPTTPFDVTFQPSTSPQKHIIEADSKSKTVPLFEQIIEKLSWSNLLERGILPPIFVEERKSIPNKRYPKCMYPLDVAVAEPRNERGLMVGPEITRRGIYDILCRVSILSDLSHKKGCQVMPDRQFLPFDQIWSTLTSEPYPHNALKGQNVTFWDLLSKMPNTIYTTDVPITYAESSPGSSTNTNDFLIKTSWELVNHTTAFEIAFPKSVTKDQEWYLPILRILAKYALAKRAGSPLTKVGMILPISRQVLIADLSAWDSSLLLPELLTTIPTRGNQLRIHRGFVSRSIGYHIKKGSNLMKTLEEWFTGKRLIPNLAEMLEELTRRDMSTPERYSTIIEYLRSDAVTTYSAPPCQIFYRSPQSEYSSANISGEMFGSIAELIKQTQGRLFVHTPYILNLARSNVNLLALQEDLTYCRTMGGKGVVVHVGKQLKMSKEEAWTNMIRNVMAVIPYATTECPLLLETPAGQGTEMLVKLEEMIKFINAIRQILEDDDSLCGYINRFCICVDTCHVYAAGYDPEFYLRQLLFAFPRIVKLIHLNDSEKHCGCRVDRHYPIGGGFTAMLDRTWQEITKEEKHEKDEKARQDKKENNTEKESVGHIGMTKLADVIDLGMQHGIPMVIE
jgi:deoxyribonuclease-4